MTANDSSDGEGARQYALFEADGRIGRITLNRPERRNALSAVILRDVHAALDSFEADTNARVGVLSGAGPSFCAGFDLTPDSASVQSTKSDPWRDRERLQGWIELALRIWEFPRPIIAQVHGHCLAGGVLFPLSCDLVFIAEDCAVGWPRVPVGAGFMDGAISLLIGQRRAKEISYIVGSRITGREAADWGFANAAVPADELEAKVTEFASRIAKTPRNVLEIRKAAITKAQINGSFREALLAGVEWDVIAHVDREVNDMRALVREYGLKAVIDAFENSDDAASTLAAANGGGK